MRVVLDTNIFVSGIFWEGNFCSKLIEKWKKGDFQLVTSLKLIEELVETLRSFKVSMPEELIEEWKSLILRNSAIVESSEKLEIIKADIDDNKFLETAIAGEADMIVSQDKHLLNLKEYKTIKIMKPEEAISMF